MKVLALIEGANEVCCRYRIEAFAEFLAEREMRLEVVRFEKGVLARIGDLRRAKSADVVILQRKLLPIWQTLLLRRWSRRLIFDVDDAVYQRDSNSSKGPESRSRSARYRAIVGRSDAVVVGNEHLKKVTAGIIQTALTPCPSPATGEGRNGASHSTETGEGRIFLLPTCIDTRKYSPALHRRVGVEARIVWIGQQSTLRSLSTAGELFREIGQRMPGMEFRQICDIFVDIPGFRVVFRPWSNESETAELAEGDMGIAWMPDDTWSLGKCGLKVLQYMAAGLPVVANPVGIHRELVIHGETGFLASTPQQWADAVEQLAADPELRNKMGAAGRYLVEKRFSVAVWGEKFTGIVKGNDQ